MNNAKSARQDQALDFAHKTPGAEITSEILRMAPLPRSRFSKKTCTREDSHNNQLYLKRLAFEEENNKKNYLTGWTHLELFGHYLRKKKPKRRKKNVLSFDR